MSEDKLQQDAGNNNDVILFRSSKCGLAVS